MLTVIKVVFSAVLFLVGFSSLAADNLKMFETPLEQVSWKYSGNVFSCEISHKVKNFGKVALLALPGQNLTLNVYADNVQFNDLIVEASVVVPSWAAAQTGRVSRFAGNSHHAETSNNSDMFLRALSQGHKWRIKVFDADETPLYQVRAAAVLTQALAGKFKQCQQQLLPQPFEYVRKLDFFFPVGSDYLDPLQLEDIRAVAAYVAADRRIAQVLVDGHSDAQGEHLNNLRLSRDRADEVVARLLEFGVERRKIEVRHHGERYPQATNNSPLGKEANRRVQLRLVMAI